MHTPSAKDTHNKAQVHLKGQSRVAWWVQLCENNQKSHYSTQLRAKRECQAQKSKNVMPDCSCCLALAVPASLNIWLFFLKKQLLLCWELPGLDDAGQPASVLKCVCWTLSSPMGAPKPPPASHLNHHIALRGDLGHSCPLGGSRSPLMEGVIWGWGHGRRSAVGRLEVHGSPTWVQPNKEKDHKTSVLWGAGWKLFLLWCTDTFSICISDRFNTQH